MALVAAIKQAGKPADGVSLKVWLSKLQQVRNEVLYNAVDKAEPVCADAVRDLRRWMRAEGRGATLQRQDGARELVAWIEELRRVIIWPLSEAFQDQASDDDGMDDLVTTGVAANT